MKTITMTFEEYQQDLRDARYEGALGAAEMRNKILAYLQDPSFKRTLRQEILDWFKTLE